MAWYGPNAKANRPEARKYSLWLKDSTENLFLREIGIICLADHEIGTHFVSLEIVIVTDFVACLGEGCKHNFRSHFVR